VIRTFRNPANGHTEQISSESWLYVVVFGAIYLAYRGLWAHFFIWIVLVGGVSIVTGGPGLILALPIAVIAYGVSIKGILVSSYLRRGWEEVSDPAATIGGNASVSSNGLRDCPFCAEQIKVQAIKCKHCGSDVEPIPVQLVATVKTDSGPPPGKEWFVILPFGSNKEFHAISEKVRELGHEVHSETSKFLRVGPCSTKTDAGEILRLFSMKHAMHGNLEEAASTSQ
jgi:hypothetical protein